MADLTSFATTFLACLSALAVKELYTKATSETTGSVDKFTSTPNDSDATEVNTISGIKQKLIEKYFHTSADNPASTKSKANEAAELANFKCLEHKSGSASPVDGVDGDEARRSDSNATLIDPVGSNKADAEQPKKKKKKKKNKKRKSKKPKVDGSSALSP